MWGEYVRQNRAAVLAIIRSYPYEYLAGKYIIRVSGLRAVEVRKLLAPYEAAKFVAVQDYLVPRGLCVMLLPRVPVVQLPHAGGVPPEVAEHDTSASTSSLRAKATRPKLSEEPVMTDGDAIQCLRAMRNLLRYNRAGWCGPTSLSCCLATLGIDRSPGSLIDSIGLSRSDATSEGVSEDELEDMAEQLDLEAVQIWSTHNKENGSHRAASAKKHERRYFDSEHFKDELAAHLSQGWPALLCIGTDEPFDHWVAVLEFDNAKQRFVVMDPDEDDQGFDRWSRKKLHAKSFGEKHGDHHLALLLMPRERKRKPVTITSRLYKLANSCGINSATRIKILSLDLADLLANAGHQGHGAWNTGPVSLDGWLAEHRRTILEAIDFWVAPSARQVKLGRVDARLRSYIRCASAFDVRIPQDRTVERDLLAGMTTLLTTHAILKVDKELSYGD